MSNSITLTRHFDPADRARDEFPLLPFEVPDGVGRLHVSYEVSDALGADKAGQEQGNIVDVGLFDPRGADFLRGRGFRGWSGTARREFSVGPADATPGYLPGPLIPGTWHVVLGLYQLLPGGCDLRVTVRLEPGAGGGTTLLPCAFERAPIVAGPRWFRGDLHAHSHHSDGSAPLVDLIRAAQAQGLDFIAITEHNTVSHLPRLHALSSPPGPPLLIPGMEISTYHGHANVWPVDDWLDFRCWQDDQMRRVRELARQRGALFSVNHPKDDGPPWAFGELFNPDCIEVWGAPWFISNYQSLAVWDGLLRQGRRVTAVGGSDKHQGPFSGELGWYELGTPTTYVWADALSIPAIVAGLRAGRVWISEGPHGPRLELLAEAGERRAGMGQELPVAPGDTLRLRCRVGGGAGCILRLISAVRTLETPIDADEFVYEWQLRPSDDRYFRPEVIDPPEEPLDVEPGALMMRALGNPVYLSRVVV